MSFGQHRRTIDAADWYQISASEDANVTIENFSVGAYQSVRIISGATPPAPGDPVENFRTLTAGRQHTFTNLDEGTVLWARAVNEPVVIEVLTG